MFPILLPLRFAQTFRRARIAIVRAGEKQQTKLLVAENGPFGTPFLTPKTPPPQKFMWVPFLRSFPGNEAHKLFSGGPNWGISGGTKKFMLKKFMCCFCPLDWPRPTQGLPEESKKSTPKQGPRSPKKSDSFRTLLRLQGALFRDFRGPAPGHSFRTLLDSSGVPPDSSGA